MQPIETYLKQSPFIAILRGVKPDEVVEVADAIIEAGWRCIEVPLNSPEPFKSIELLTKKYGERILSGGGTVLTVENVVKVGASGGQLIVAPNTNIEVIKAAVSRNMVVMPGFVTPTEAFAAYDAGARYIKLFPADSYGPAYIKAIRAVLPKDALVVPVGGVTPETVAAFHQAGSVAYGIGSAVYKPGMTAAEAGQKATAFMAAWRKILSSVS